MSKLPMSAIDHVTSRTEALQNRLAPMAGKSDDHRKLFEAVGRAKTAMMEAVRAADTIISLPQQER